MRTPKEIVFFTYETSKAKIGLSNKNLILLSILAGFYISIGGMFSLVAYLGVPEIAHANPSLAKLLMGLTFPVGLAIITIAGAELFTGNCATLVPSAMNSTIKWSGLVKNWTFVWIGNFIGSLFFAYFLVYLPGIINNQMVDGLLSIGVAKVSQPFFVILLKGVGANWLVCLAVWLALASKTSAGKIFSLWIPVALFVAVGYEHCIANMFIIPLSMMHGADINLSQMMINNIVPATIGNIIGGMIFVGFVYGVAYGQKKTKND